jgi:hypothetical protein
MWNTFSFITIGIFFLLKFAFHQLGFFLSPFGKGDKGGFKKVLGKSPLAPLC